MKITGLHLLLTYRCTFECAHCFAWGSPWQSGVMTLQNIRSILEQAAGLGTVGEIYFEGGEPFLYYATLVEGIRLAKQSGFTTGVVSNAYWATSLEDALLWLKPLAGLVDDLTISSDRFHYDEMVSRQALDASAAARQLGIPLGTISIAEPGSQDGQTQVGQLSSEAPGSVMYRGRAAVELSGKVPGRPWRELDTCPFEDLHDPGRIHVDPLGYLHLCQGLALGNLFHEPLAQIVARRSQQVDPITEALWEGGPAALVARFALPHRELYADACHLCYESRLALRGRFPEVLAPDQMYGVY